MSGEVIVVGGGVIGTACALKLAVDNDVVVFERDKIASGTTGAASGLITTPKVYHNAPRFAEHAVEFFRNLEKRTDCSFEERPYLQLVRSKGISIAERTARSGVSFLGSEEAAERYPDTFGSLDDYEGLLEYQNCGFLDPVEYTHALKRSAEDAGVTFHTDTPVSRILSSGGAVRGVETPRGTRRARKVVCATGWRTLELLDGVVELPVRPVRWQAVCTGPDREMPNLLPMGSEGMLNVYWRPRRDGTLLFGGNEQFSSPGTGSRDPVDAEFVETVREFSRRVLNVEVTIVETEQCPVGDTTTPDRRPIVDSPNEGPDGLFVVTGFHGSGVMASPSIAEYVRSVVASEGRPFDVDFRLDRFNERSQEFAFPPPPSE